MNTDERIKVLEDEFQITKEEIKQILLDIRTALMEAQTPLPVKLDARRLPEENDSEKGVESDGNE